MSIRQGVGVQSGDRALTFREAKELYGIPEHRLRQYRAERALDFFKLGRAVFVSERSLVKFLESHRELAASGSNARSKLEGRSNSVPEKLQTEDTLGRQKLGETTRSDS